MLNNQRIFDRVISVKMDRFEKEAERREGELPTGLRGIGMGLGANGAPLADVASIISSLAPSGPAPQPYSNGNGLAAPQIHPFGGNPYGTPMPQPAPAAPAMIVPQQSTYADHHLGGGYQAAAPQQNIYSAPAVHTQQPASGGYFAASQQSAPTQPVSAANGPMSGGGFPSRAGYDKPTMGSGGGYTATQHAPAPQSYGGGPFGGPTGGGSAGGGGYESQSSRVILIKNVSAWQGIPHLILMLPI